MPPTPAKEPEPTESEAPRPAIAKRRIKREFAIPKVSFRRLVQEIADEFKGDLRLQQDAVDALQESAETLLTERFHRCSELADLCKLDTVREEHWRFVQA